MSDANQWAYLKDVSYHNDTIPIFELGNSRPYLLSGHSYIEFSGIAPATPHVLQAMQKWMYGEGVNIGSELPLHRDEWLCLYCGGANALKLTKCHHCNAVRSWLIG